MDESFSAGGSRVITNDPKETPTFSRCNRLLKHLHSAQHRCCPLTEMAFMQSRYVAFCRQLNAVFSCCMWSLRLLHLFSSAEDIVHHLMLALGEAAKHRAVERTRSSLREVERQQLERNSISVNTRSLVPCNHG